MAWIKIVVTVAVLGAGALGVSYLWTGERFRGGGAAPQVAAEAVYYCPMHPQQRSNKPGNCPICSMQLVRFEAAQAAGGITIPPERRQVMGVRSAAAQRRALAREIRTVGKVAIDERRITHIHTKVSGFIDEVFVDFVGKPVRRGDALFTLYSPELLATQEEYLLALRSRRTLGGAGFEWITTGSARLVEAARRRLELWDVSEKEIAELEQTGKAKRALTVYSPVDGVVTHRAAYHHGRQVSPEMDLYTIADLSVVWVLGEIYEADLAYVRKGQTVHIELPFAGVARRRTGTLVFLSPALDWKTRTAQARVELDNADQSLRPDMFLNFSIRLDLGIVLAVPSPAVLDTGTEQYVFVDKGDGYFEPRRVGVGHEAQGYTEILEGLREGERVVTEGNFLLDSESRLKGAFAGMGTPSETPPGHKRHD